MERSTTSEEELKCSDDTVMVSRSEISSNHPGCAEDFASLSPSSDRTICLPEGDLVVVINGVPVKYFHLALFNIFHFFTEAMLSQSVTQTPDGRWVWLLKDFPGGLDGFLQVSKNVVYAGQQPIEELEDTVPNNLAIYALESLLSLRIKNPDSILLGDNFLQQRVMQQIVSSSELFKLFATLLEPCFKHQMALDELADQLAEHVVRFRTEASAVSFAGTPMSVMKLAMKRAAEEEPSLKIMWNLHCSFLTESPTASLDDISELIDSIQSRHQFEPSHYVRQLKLVQNYHGLLQHKLGQLLVEKVATVALVKHCKQVVSLPKKIRDEVMRNVTNGNEVVGVLLASAEAGGSGGTLSNAMWDAVLKHITMITQENLEKLANIAVGSTPPPDSSTYRYKVVLGLMQHMKSTPSQLRLFSALYTASGAGYKPFEICSLVAAVMSCTEQNDTAEKQEKTADALYDILNDNAQFLYTCINLLTKSMCLDKLRVISKQAHSVMDKSDETIYRREISSAAKDAVYEREKVQQKAREEVLSVQVEDLKAQLNQILVAAAEKKAAKQAAKEKEAALALEKKLAEEKAALAAKIAAEQKLAAEKKLAEEKLAAEKKAAEEKAAAEQKKAEEEAKPAGEEVKPEDGAAQPVSA